MPSATLTPEQSRAIETRNISVALSAGAGCGKTHVLTERFLSHLEPAAEGAKPARLGQLVAITFTDAAAREMRTRIRNACYDRLTSAATNDEQEHWLRLLREIDSARVSTIHAFCASLLRSHAAAAGLDPSFAVLDQGDADLLQYDSIDDVLREQLEKLDDDTLDLATAYGLSRVKEQLAVLLGQRHDPNFKKWIDATPDDVVASWLVWHETYAFPLAVQQFTAEAPITGLIETLRVADMQGKSEKFHEARFALLDLLPRLQNGQIASPELTSIRKYAQVQGICKSKDWQTPGDYESYRDSCKELRDVIDKHQPKPFDAARATETAMLGLALLRLAAKVVENYESRKQAKNALDFDDLLSAAHALISHPNNAELGNQLAEDLHLLLVDEFQDTDQLQVDLVRALCGSGFDVGRLFFVGDFKQSIYRFRGAAPQVFQDLRDQVQDAGRLPLTVNFRSQPAILHFVNALFCDAFGSDEQSYEALHASRDQTTDPAAVEFLWTIAPDKNNKGIAGAALNARRQEARAIARRLRSLMDGANDERPIVDKHTGQPRAAQLGDVAILFRTLSDVQVYEEALREYDLDYYLVGGHAFYAQQEIYDILNLLRAVASSADELSLAGVLRSPFFALADETLFWLVDSAGTLNAGLLADSLSPELSPEEHAKVIAAAATLRHLRTIKDRVPIATLLNDALDRTGYDAVLLAEFLGERKLANLNKLIERARAADNGAIDLDGFITQLAQFSVRDPKEALAATLPEAAGVIRQMTIHHAKGLEFPLVVLPDLDRPPNVRAPSAAIHADLGPLVPAPGDDDQKKFATGMSLFAAAERAAEYEERKRMLYVATTRAADYLILSSSLAAFDKPTSDWMKLIADRFNLENGELIAELPAGYEEPRVRVTTEPHTDHKPAGKPRGPDLIKLLEEARQLAADGQGIIPREVRPIPVDHAARRLFSFSRLTGRLIRADANRAAPVVSAGAAQPPETKHDPRGFGTLVHEVLAHIDFRKKDEVAEWCEHLASQHVLVNTANAVQAAREMIERFLTSPLGEQLARAPELHREVEFLLAWPPGETNGQSSCIRGYIDCLYEDADGRWCVLDFKTNNVAAVDVPRVAQQYEMQLYVYAVAAERALGQSPVELSLHFLRPGIQHILPWNDAARTRATQMVNQAISSLHNLDIASD